MKKVRTRFAPSPSGFLHVGGARTALFNFLYARATGGSFIIRVEDTDQERSSQSSEDMILDSLAWLGIKADEGVREGGPFAPYRQSERLDRYQKYTQQLVKSGAAFPCFCSGEEIEAKQKQARAMGLPYVYDGKCRGLSAAEVKKRIKDGDLHAVRFKVDQGEILVEDLVQGRVKFDARLIGDFIIVKSDGFPSYNYAVVVDDHEMEITHVIRGVGHLSNTPRQILIHQALGFPLPVYAHISEIVGTDRKKLSKRRGATSVLFFRELGYLPEAFVNYMALLGWYPDDAVEFMPSGELGTKFDVNRCSKSPAMFDFFLVEKNNTEDDEPGTADGDEGSETTPVQSAAELRKQINQKSKLNWLNNKYIRHLPPEATWPVARSFIEGNPEAAPLLKRQAAKIEEAYAAIRVYLNRLEEVSDYILEIFQENLTVQEEARAFMQDDRYRKLTDAFLAGLNQEKPADPEAFGSLLAALGKAEGLKGKDLYMPVRVATTGKMHGLELPALFSLLGPGALARRVKELQGLIYG